MEKFQALIDAYNAGAKNIQRLFEELVAFAQELNQEEQRAISQGLSEEELAIFDLLTKPGPNLTAKEQDQVKAIARDLLASLKKGKLVLDWRKKQAAKAQVQLTIKQQLRALPKIYNLIETTQKSDVIYQHIYDAYSGQGHSLYETTPRPGHLPYA